jgi:twitching motility two-component system response regulator PilG
MNLQRPIWTAQLEDEETLTLPAMPDIRPNGAIPRSVSQTAVLQFQGKTVWIIDDSPTIRAVTRFHLSRLGLTVCPFGDGLEALMHLRQFPDEVPHLILVDQELPRMDGHMVIQSLRSLPGSAQTKIVMISGRDATIDRLKGRLAGADDYLAKPVTYDRLLALTLAYLGEAVPQTSARLEEATSYVS